MPTPYQSLRRLVCIPKSPADCPQPIKDYYPIISNIIFKYKVLLIYPWYLWLQTGVPSIQDVSLIYIYRNIYISTSRIRINKSTTTTLIRLGLMIIIKEIHNTNVNPCGNFSDTSHFTDQRRFSMKGSIGHDFSMSIRTENYH